MSITIYATLSRSIIIPTYDLGFDIYIGFIPIPTIYVLVQPIIVLFIIKLAIMIDLLVVINMASILTASYHLKAWELGICVIALSILSTSGCCAGPPLIFLIAPELSKLLGYGVWIYMNMVITSLLLVIILLKIKFISKSGPVYKT
ncbi:MAG: hypothetical protein QXE01_05450 [Sulfolobales archaeon]